MWLLLLGVVVFAVGARRHGQQAGQVATNSGAGAARAAPAGASAASAAAAGPSASHSFPVKVRPTLGASHTRFVVTFPRAGTVRRYAVSAAGPRGKGCQGTAEAASATAAAAGHERATLVAAPGSGGWCAGVYRGLVRSLIVPACGGPGVACPMYIRVGGTVGRFAFRVK